MKGVYLMKQLTVTLQNEPGALNKLCDELTRTGINITSLFGEGLDSQGIVHVITEDSETARKTLEKAGYLPKTSDVLAIKVADKPGELGKVLRKLAHAQINVETVSLLSRERGEATVVMKVNNIKKAQEALKE